MISQFMPVILKNAGTDLARELPHFLQGGLDIFKVLDFCQLYRIRGIATLLLIGTSEDLMRDLQRSAQAYIYFLKHAKDEQKLTSKVAPFFDAIACGDIDLATQIAQSSRTTFNKTEEYEEDFLYVVFLMKHFFLNASENECRNLIKKFEELAGEDDPRLFVCKALLDKDGKAFGKALRLMINSHEEYYKNMFNDGRIVEEVAATEGNYFVEGQALLRLALMKGIPIEKRYKFIPTAMETCHLLNDSPDAWTQL